MLLYQTGLADATWSFWSASHGAGAVMRRVNVPPGAFPASGCKPAVPAVLPVLYSPLPMAFEPQSLQQLSRAALAELAKGEGILRADAMTRSELADELLRASVSDLDRRKRLRGWFGAARDLLASLVQRGLNLPEAAARAEPALEEPSPQAPLPTLTLARIYEAQGHRTRALGVAKDVLHHFPGDTAAEQLLERLASSPSSASRALQIHVMEDDGAARVSWELLSGDMARDGAFLTVVIFANVGGAVRRGERAFELDAETGEMTVDALPPGSCLCAAITQSGTRRRVLVVAPPPGPPALVQAAGPTADAPAVPGPDLGSMFVPVP